MPREEETSTIEVKVLDIEEAYKSGWGQVGFNLMGESNIGIFRVEYRGGIYATKGFVDTLKLRCLGNKCQIRIVGKLNEDQAVYQGRGLIKPPR